MAEDVTTSIESVVGHTDNEVLDDGDVVIYDYDRDDQFIGWHKEVAGQ
jgi:hypothetical protein